MPEIRDGDILILHTGWHRHYEGQPQQDLVPQHRAKAAVKSAHDAPE